MRIIAATVSVVLTMTAGPSASAQSGLMQTAVQRCSTALQGLCHHVEKDGSNGP